MNQREGGQSANDVKTKTDIVSKLHVYNQLATT